MKTMRKKKKKIKKKKKKKISQKKIRIITIATDKNDCKNDMNVYIDIFKKLGYKIDTHILDTNPKIHIKYAFNPYYDINLFIDRIVPLNFNIKTIFPSGVNIFAPNVNTFQNYKELRDIDIILCNTKQCYNFINFIKKENIKKYNYKFKSYYTNFTTHIPIQLSHHTNVSKIANTKSLSFIHIADNQKFKNTGPLIHCWLKYNTNLKCELHILCTGLCMTTLLLDIKKMYNYDLLNTYKFETENKIKKQNMMHNILKYKNLTLYLNLTQQNIKYKEIIKNADVAICTSRKENYPHYINSARYFNIFVITMNQLPMNELVDIKDKPDNIYFLNKMKIYKKHYPETKMQFMEYIPNIEELRDSILWCIEHQSDIRKYNISENNRKLFDNDKKYFENSMKNIMQNIKYNQYENQHENQQETQNENQHVNQHVNQHDLNTLSTIIKKSTYKFYSETEDDNHCKYINIRGIVKSCDIHSLTPISSIHDLIGYDFDTLKNNSKPTIYTIYICNSAISKFANKLKNDKAFANLNCKFILVSGDSDDTCPDDLFSFYDSNSDSDHIFKEFIENDKIIHWYSQNCVQTNHTFHKKLSQLPIGLGYHHLHNEDIEEDANKIISPMKQEAVLDNIIHNSKQMKLPFWKRELKCYINFNFEKNYMRSRFGYDRYEALTKIPNNLIFSEKGEVDRTTSWNNQSKYAFVASPFGNGLDCHRTWEAIILGCIPIVKTSGLDSLYDDLPVLIVNDWTDITEKLLMIVISEFKLKHEKGEFNYYKLTLKYWIDKINSHKII